VGVSLFPKGLNFLEALNIEFLNSVWTSVQLGILASLGTLIVALLAILALRLYRKRNWIQKSVPILMVLPSGVSVLVLGLGFWLTYSNWPFGGVDPFEGSFTAMLVLQITLFAPVAFRVFWGLDRGSNEGIHRDRIQAAMNLGAKPLEAHLMMEWPRWRGPIVWVGLMIFGASLGEVAALSLFYSENLIPLPMYILRLLSQYRFEEAYFLSSFTLMAVGGGLILLKALWPYLAPAGTDVGEPVTKPSQN